MAKFCTNCGKELPEDARACPSCGRMVGAKPAQSGGAPIIVKNSNINAVPAASVTRSKWVALLLCFFLGFLFCADLYGGTGLISPRDKAYNRA